MILSGFTIHGPKNSTSNGKKQVTPCVTLYKGGTVNFNRLAVELIKLEEDDKVLFFQSESQPSEWYFTVHESEGFRLHQDKKAIRFYCENLAKRLIASYPKNDKEGKILRLKIADKPTKIHDLFVWSLIYDKELADHYQPA